MSLGNKRVRKRQRLHAAHMQLEAMSETLEGQTLIRIDLKNMC